MVWIGEATDYGKHGLKVHVRTKFGSVVEHNGLEQVRFCTDDPSNSSHRMRSGPFEKLGEPGQAGHALYEGKETLVTVLPYGGRIRFLHDSPACHGLRCIVTILAQTTPGTG